MPEATSAPYWVFVCNPKKWAIDQFLEQGREHDTWGVRPSDGVTVFAHACKMGLEGIVSKRDPKC